MLNNFDGSKEVRVDYVRRAALMLVIQILQNAALATAQSFLGGIFLRRAQLSLGLEAQERAVRRLAPRLLVSLSFSLGFPVELGFPRLILALKLFRWADRGIWNVDHLLVVLEEHSTVALPVFLQLPDFLFVDLRNRLPDVRHDQLVAASLTAVTRRFAVCGLPTEPTDSIPVVSLVLTVVQLDLRVPCLAAD